jgi:hypothetical protein
MNRPAAKPQMLRFGRVMEGLSMRMKWQDCIEGRKEVMTGDLIFKGTRVSVKLCCTSEVRG